MQQVGKKFVKIILILLEEGILKYNYCPEYNFVESCKQLGLKYDLYIFL